MEVITSEHHESQPQQQRQVDPHVLAGQSFYITVAHEPGI